MDVDTIRDVDKLLEFYKANTKEKTTQSNNKS